MLAEDARWYRHARFILFARMRRQCEPSVLAIASRANIFRSRAIADKC